MNHPFLKHYSLVLNKPFNWPNPSPASSFFSFTRMQWVTSEINGPVCTYQWMRETPQHNANRMKQVSKRTNKMSSVKQSKQKTSITGLDGGWKKDIFKAFVLCHSSQRKWRSYNSFLLWQFYFKMTSRRTSVGLRQSPELVALAKSLLYFYFLLGFFLLINVTMYYSC